MMAKWGCGDARFDAALAAGADGGGGGAGGEGGEDAAVPEV
jgi:hypothetical protein